MEAGDADTNDALFACHALDLLTEDQRAQEAIEDLEADRRPPCHVRTPIYRSRRAAARNSLPAFLAVLIAAILFSLGGWPFASLGLALVGVFVALSANTPSPRKFAVAAVVAIPMAALLAGVTEFLILDGVDQFPLLAIGMAPSVLSAALLFTLPNARISSIGFLVLVFFPLLLSPANPQDYNPEAYLYRSLLAITAVILVFAVSWTILPTSDDLRRRWYLASARAELRDLLAGRRSRHRDDSPANPQDYNPEAYLYRSLLAITAVILVFAVSWTILPTSDDLRRRWLELPRCVITNPHRRGVPLPCRLTISWLRSTTGCRQLSSVNLVSLS